MGSSGRTGGSAKVGATPTDLEQMEEGLAFQDFQDFREHGAVKKNELFDEQFLHFMALITPNKIQSQRAHFKREPGSGTHQLVDRVLSSRQPRAGSREVRASRGPFAR